MRHIISILLQNESGALARVSGMFAARGYNIESLTVAPTQDPSLSRLTLVTMGSDEVIDQIVKQSRKLIDVVEVLDVTARAHSECELMLIKLRVASRAQEAFDAVCAQRALHVLEAAGELRCLRAAGTGTEIDEIAAELGAIGEVVELVRSGVAAIETGSAVLGARVLATAG
ncbi:acetolactate synthase small subunit [Algiphilus sp.]|uniref:acetolactate synthase small subunit n=1 Tax=Algiphilus sp. TaxID=1872431 RepID=UPI0032F07FF4